MWIITFLLLNGRFHSFLHLVCRASTLVFSIGHAVTTCCACEGEGKGAFLWSEARMTYSVSARVARTLAQTVTNIAGTPKENIP